VELRWTTTDFISLTSPSATASGFGDNWFGPQVRLYRQTPHVPSIAVGYAAKFHSASAAKGLGSGRTDHQLQLLVSKDLFSIHFDFNASTFWIGRPGGVGYDRNAQFNLAFGHALYRTLQVQGEFYGNTRLNASTAGYASGLAALVWMVTPRLELDAGLDTGMSHSAPRRRVFVGFTYSIANLYQAARGHGAAAARKN
ncbi:MAG: transporter, partial [Bryobacteraceae bacterium]